MYLLKGNLSYVEGEVRAGHLELEVNENKETVEAMLKDPELPRYLFEHGKFVVDNFYLAECGDFSSITYEEIDDVIDGVWSEEKLE